MLHLKFFDDLDVSPSEIVSDVEKLFKMITLTGTEKEREALRKLEQAEFLDNFSFIDRFGYKLPITFMSTGCKAILCVLNRPDVWISTIECGMNALSLLISLCQDEKVIMDDKGVTFTTIGLNTDISVELDGRVFNNTE